MLWTIPTYLKNIHPNVRRDFDQNVDVAVGRASPRAPRAEQSSMAHTLRLQGRLMLAQPGKDVLLSMGPILPEVLFPAVQKTWRASSPRLTRIKYLYFQ